MKFLHCLADEFAKAFLMYALGTVALVVVFIITK